MRSRVLIDRMPACRLILFPTPLLPDLSGVRDRRRILSALRKPLPDLFLGGLVAGLHGAVSCSLALRNDLGFGLELGNQGGGISDLDAGAALGRLDHFQGCQARGDIDIQIRRLDHLERLFLGLHDVG